MNKAHTKIIADTLLGSPWHMQTLRAVRGLGLPDWAIGAGFVRNAVWDRLHAFDAPTPLSDLDILFFDPSDLSTQREAAIEVALVSALSDRPWSVRNQARMHIRNCDDPYASTADALRYWLETPTCVAVRLNGDDSLAIIAPYGLSDLINMRGVPTARGREHFNQYLDRMCCKNWPATWPQVSVEGLE